MESSWTTLPLPLLANVASAAPLLATSVFELRARSGSRMAHGGRRTHAALAVVASVDMVVFAVRGGGWWWWVEKQTRRGGRVCKQ